MNNTQSCDTEDGEFGKQHHEGHTGYLAIDVAYDHIDGWLNDTKPDIVMFMLGTDDIARGRRLEDVVEAYTNMVQSMRQYNEHVHIIANTVVPLPVNMNPVKRLNDMIPDWAVEQNKTESPIYVNDIYPFPNTFLKDGIHPNDEGEDRIADGLNSLLTWIINSNSTGNTTVSG
ncbi:putative carbohydrate esterase family 3 protein [Daldinia childiae]|uniref:putative carbohydrate esterase family 3 protein n=1 Tax=Daldinia childiae TaxID=326645 RepID=UPI0014456EB6|nr:putative carbohydrate esterase family 3 protein [Daldinia childiae]KAF3055851.1 putative carbohydrate esterase family 3 protein [Daldinia childiae]